MDQQDKFECELEADDLKKFGPNSWLVRPCEWYKQEYSDCKCKYQHMPFYFTDFVFLIIFNFLSLLFLLSLTLSLSLNLLALRGRIHQYFVHGKTNICDDWRDDFYNCKLFRKTKEPQYVVSLHRDCHQCQ